MTVLALDRPTATASDVRPLRSRRPILALAACMLAGLSGRRAEAQAEVRNLTQPIPVVNTGGQWAQGRWYFIGFSSISVPTGTRDVLMLYNDVSVGYFAYRNPDPDGWLRAIAPTFETHVNIPLNHRDVFNIFDVAGTADMVNLTYGVNSFLGDRSVLSMGIVTPVTGPRPFALEALAYLNIFF